MSDRSLVSSAAENPTVEANAMNPDSGLEDANHDAAESSAGIRDEDILLEDPSHGPYLDADQGANAIKRHAVEEKPEEAGEEKPEESGEEKPEEEEKPEVHDRLPVTPPQMAAKLFFDMKFTGRVCKRDKNTPKFGYYIEVTGTGLLTESGEPPQQFVHHTEILKNESHWRASLKPGENVEFQFKPSPKWQNYDNHQMFQAAGVTGPGGVPVQGEEKWAKDRLQVGGGGGGYGGAVISNPTQNVAAVASGGGGGGGYGGAAVIRGGFDWVSQAPPVHQAMPLFPGNYSFSGTFPSYQPPTWPQRHLPLPPVLNQMQGQPMMYSSTQHVAGVLQPVHKSSAPSAELREDSAPVGAVGAVGAELRKNSWSSWSGTEEPVCPRIQRSGRRSSLQ